MGSSAARFTQPDAARMPSKSGERFADKPVMPPKCADPEAGRVARSGRLPAITLGSRVGKYFVDSNLAFVFDQAERSRKGVVQLLKAVFIWRHVITEVAVDDDDVLDVVAPDALHQNLGV